MARNTIVAIMMGVTVLLLIALSAMNKITGEVLGYSITGVSTVGGIIIGVVSEDSKKKNAEIEELKQMIEELKSKVS